MKRSTWTVGIGAIGVLFLGAGEVRAGTIAVNLEPAAGADLAAQLGLDLTALENQVSAEIEEAFALVNPGDYLTAFADAAAFSNKGLGVDYASTPSLFVVGVTGNVAAGTGDNGFDQVQSDRPVAGLAANLSIMGGLNLDLVGLPGFTLFLNGFSRGITIDQLSGDLTNFGAHLQYNLFPPDGDMLDLLFRWGGLAFTTGIEFSRLTLELEENLVTDLPLAAAGQGLPDLDAQLASTGSLRFQLDAKTIPFEITTNFRLLYILTIFVGAGMDLQFGSGTMTAQLNGNLSADDPINPGQQIDLGQATVEATEEAGPSAGKLRFLGGVQIGLWALKLFVQANLMPDRAVGVAFGARVAW